MRVGLDATPLLGPRTGVGQYVARLAESLAASGGVDELRLVPFTWRGAEGLTALASTASGLSGGGTPAGEGVARSTAPHRRPDLGGEEAGSTPVVRARRRRVPARALREAWARTGWPPVEWFAGRVDVFHATNFVAP